MPDWPADKVERWPIDRLIPYARNARTHSDAQVAQIAARVFANGDGRFRCSSTRQGGLIAGHGRVYWRRSGSALTEVPVMVARGWSEAKKRAYVIADNKLALNAGWDPELLRLELADLREHGAATCSLIGFADDETRRACSAPAERGPDRSRRRAGAAAGAGDRCPAMCGCSAQHRLVCGDSTEAAMSSRRAWRARFRT